MKFLHFGVLLFPPIWASEVSAQVTLAEISGRVRDESRAVLPGALLTAIQAETGNSRSSNNGERWHL